MGGTCRSTTPRADGTADRAERRFHQGVLAAWSGLTIAVASTAVAPWLAVLAAIVQLAGSVSSRLSLTRALHRWLFAPARSELSAAEPQLAFERADALTGTVAIAGAVFVLAGVHPLGWALVGVSVVSLGLDAALDLSPLRRLADWVTTHLGP